MERFSKKQLAIEIWKSINYLENKYGFKSYNGWNQVNGKGEELNRQYGKYECLLSLTNEFNLEYPKI